MPNLDRVIELQEFTPGAGGDPFGGLWATTAEVWAQRMDRSALERYVSATDLATVDAAFLIRYREDVTTAWRILDDRSNIWDIEGALETERRRWLLVTAKRTGPSGR